MTRQELETKVRSAEEANIVLDLLLAQVKPEFIRSVLQGKINETEKHIQELIDAEYIYICNGSYHVNWNPSKDREKQSEASRVIYDLNHFTTLYARMF